MKRLTLTEVLDAPALAQGQADDLICDHPAGIRIWRSRLTVEDGQPYDHQVTVEKRGTDGWYSTEFYQPLP